MDEVGAVKGKGNRIGGVEKKKKMGHEGERFY